jgi:hypothetical protein
MANSSVTFEIYDVLGGKVMADQLGSGGSYTQFHTIDITGLKSGIYFVAINAGTSRVTKKIQVVN